MSDALIGHTGFVGGNLAAQHRFNAWFNSRNVEAVRGRRFDRLVVCAMPGDGGAANADPGADAAALERLWGCVREARAEAVVVISTTEVYPYPLGVDEETLTEPTLQQPYGRNRQWLERLAAAHFPRSLCLRLPTAFGPGLARNPVRNLLHDHRTEHLHPDSELQFYDLGRLWADAEAALDAGLAVANLVTEPVSVREVAREALGVEFVHEPPGHPVRSDVRTRHAAVFGGSGGYVESRGRVLTRLRAFAAGRDRVRVAA